MTVTKVTGMMQTSTKGGDITSASPCVIDTDGDYFDIAGTVSFAAFTVVAGRRFTVQFDGILTMTHHVTTLDLPGGANITTAAGDVAEFFATGTNTVQCVNYTKADGTAVALADNAITLAKMAGNTDGVIISYDASGDPVAVGPGSDGEVLTSTGAGSPPAFEAAAGGGWAYVSTATASNSASLAFTNMVIGYDYQYIEESIVHASGATSHLAELGIAGPTYRTASYLSSCTYILNAQNSTQSIEVTSDIRIVANASEDMGDQTDEALYRYKLELSNPVGTTNRTAWTGIGSLYGGTPTMVSIFSMGIYNGASEAHTSIKFSSSSGNITSGIIYQYRRKLS